MATPLKIGLIGAGGISGSHLRAFPFAPDRIRLTAVFDVNPAAAEKRAAEAGGAAVFPTLDAMLADGDFDAALICTVHDQHRDGVLRCLAAGKHVLVEKPLGVNYAECQEMVAAAGAADRVLMVAQCQRYVPSYVGVRRLLRDGRLGDVRAVRFDSHQHIQSFVPADHWLLDGKAAGGGIVISVSVHRIDLMRYFIGDVKRVCAVGRRTSPAFRNNAENFVAATLEFENGAIGEMFGTYSGYRMPWGEMFMIFGDRGTIHAVPALGDYLGGARIATMDAPNPIHEWLDQYAGFTPLATGDAGLPSEDEFVNQLLHFADCVHTGAEPWSSGRDNLGTMRVVFGIYESLRTGAPVELAALEK